MSEYEIKWQRDSSEPRPEDVLDDADRRKEAVRQILADIGVDEDEYCIEPTKRILSGELPYFVIANLAFTSITTVIEIKRYIEEQEDDAVLGEELKKRIDAEWEEEDG